MNMVKVGLVVAILIGGIGGGAVFADVFGFENSMQRIGFIAGYTMLGALSLAFWAAIGAAFYRWIKR